MSSVSVQTVGMTLSELMLELGRIVGLLELVDASGTKVVPQLPTDPSRLALLESRVNAGYSAFLNGEDPLASRAARRPYTRWSFLSRQVDIDLSSVGTGPLNVAADSARYRLPSDIQSVPIGGWTLTTDGQYPGPQLVSTSVSEVLRRLVPVTSLGYPTHAACRPIPNEDLQDGVSGGVAWEVILAPRPGTGMSISGEFRLATPPLADANQRHVCGAQHDRAILLLAACEWYASDDKAGGMYDRFAGRASAALVSSIDLDKAMRPSNRGRVVDPSVYDGSFVTRADAIRSQPPSLMTYEGVFS